MINVCSTCMHVYDRFIYLLLYGDNYCFMKAVLVFEVPHIIPPNIFPLMHMYPCTQEAELDSREVIQMDGEDSHVVSSSTNFNYVINTREGGIATD